MRSIATPVRVLTVVVALAALAFGCRAIGLDPGQASFWAGAIEDFEAADAEAKPEPGRIVFAGSSSIRFWDSLERDMAPLSVLNRGFGGAHMAHVLHYADRIIAPYAPRAVVLYVGDNDIAADKTPETVVADYRALVEHLQRDRPALPIYFLTIKPSRLRWSLWPEMAETNARIAAIAAGDPSLQVIDVSTAMIEAGEGDKPPRALFALDGLHLSDEGYALWAEIVRTRLLADLGS